MFIARISRGRTIREFVIGVLFVPTAFTFLWMTVFGNTAISLDLGGAAGGIARAVQANLSTALFKFFEYLPATSVTPALAILLVGVFFITSADSGALVIDTLASGGEEDTPRWQRMYWCILLGVTAALLLVAGGLGALQAATLLAALPFCFIMLMLAFGLIRQTNADLAGVALAEDASKAEILRQMNDNAVPAFRTVCEAMVQEGWAESRVEHDVDGASLTIMHGPDQVMVYRVAPRSRPLAAYTAMDAPEGRRSITWTLSASTVGVPGGRDVTGFSAEQIASEVLSQLERWKRR